MAPQVEWVQGEAVRYVMWMSVINSLVSFIMAQFLGTALDRYPQKVVMLAPFMGFLVLHVVCVVVAAAPSLPISLLYLGAVFNGLSGGYPVFKSSMSSYVVRTVTVEERTFRLAVVEGMVFLGNAVGPFTLQQVLSYITSPHDYLFLGSEAAVAVAALYIMLVLPHSSAEAQNNAPRLQEDINSCFSVKTVLLEFTGSLSTAVRKRSGRRRGSILLLIMADFFIAIVFAAEFDILYLYMQEQMGFTLAQYSCYLFIKNLVNGVSLLGVLPRLRETLKLDDVSLGVLGGLSRVAAFTMLALNRSHTLVFVVPFLDVFGQYLFVVLRSVLCDLVNTEEQGRVLTVLSSLAQMSLLVGSLIFDNLYPVFLSLGHPGYTFCLAAVFMAFATIILGYIGWCLAGAIKSEETQPLLR